MKRTLRVTLSVTLIHLILDRAELVDKACTKEHVHKGVKITVAVKEPNNGFIDFKQIKEAMFDVLDITLEDQKINANVLMSHGDATIETFASYIHSKMVNKLAVSQHDVIVDIQETPKYGFRFERDQYE